jgi:hypothetical protein
VEPWKLLEALAEKLKQIDRISGIALKLVEEGPKLAEKEKATEIISGQKAAAEHVLANDITVIWGPPGTGKTYTMAMIALSAFLGGMRVLVVSHSNISVDGVVNQTVKLVKEGGNSELLDRGKILRYGYVRDDELSKEPRAVAFSYALGKHPGLKSEMERLLEEKRKLNTTGAFSKERQDIEVKLREIRKQIHREEQSHMLNAAMVATTVSKLTIDKVFEDQNYDLVMFDEVSMAYVPQLIVAASFAKLKFVAVGDFRQLPPIVQSDASKTLGKDIFSFLGIADNKGGIHAHPWLVMLNEQRRMHPDIAAFPNRAVYQKLLLDHESVLHGRDEIANRKPLPSAAMALIDLTGTFCSAWKNSDNSRFNILSACISFATAMTAEKNGEKNIGIISPYKAQTRLIEAMIQDQRAIKNSEIACATVHQFQGSERNMIVFDAVESYPSTKTGWLMGKDLSNVLRLINVALTRARGKFIAVANTKFWCRTFEGSQHLLYRLIQHRQTESGNGG